MKNIPTLFQGDDISVRLTYGNECADIIIDNFDDSEFTDVFTDEFGSDITITEAAGKILINNIVQNNIPTVTITDEAILFDIARDVSKQYEKGLLEVELILTLDYDGTVKHLVKKVAIGWIKDAYTTSF